MKKLWALTVLAAALTACDKDNSPSIVTPLTIRNFAPSTDGPGAPVTITGSGFGTSISNITVSFNGTVASIVSVTDTSLIVTVPAGGTDGKIGVSVKQQKVFSSQDFIYLKGVWIKRASLPGPGDFRLGTTGFSLNGKGYVGFGVAHRSDNDLPLNDLYEYDTLFNTWTQKADLPGTGRNGAVAAVVAGKSYLVGGSIDDQAGKELWMYDPSVDQWTPKASFPGSARINGIVFTINNKIYFGAGIGLSDYYLDWWEYDPATNVWTRKADFPGSFPRGGCGFSIGDKGYMGIGVNSREWWQYEATTDQWTMKNDFPIAVKYASGNFAIGGKGYIVAGINNSTWEYDPANDSWTQKTSFYQPRDVGYSFSISSLGYFGYGLNPDTNPDGSGPDKNKDCWSFDPQ